MFSAEDEAQMQRALQLARQAEERGEVPVGAVLTLNHEIIAEGWNQPILSHDPTAHAEIVALRAAAEKLQNYRLPETILYVTLEPCMMCMGAMIHARVKRLVFGAHDPRVGATRFSNDYDFNHTVLIESGLLEKECAEILKSFFQKRR